jgi:putative FmdB family regulatory protein
LRDTCPCRIIGLVPTYDYQCRSCGNRTEIIHSMHEDGPTTCELCGGALKRVFYPTGIIFKGSGFYSTDSRASSGSTGSRAGKGSSGGDAQADAAPSTKSTGASAADGGKPAGNGSSSSQSSESGGGKESGGGSKSGDRGGERNRGAGGESRSS